MTPGSEASDVAEGRSHHQDSDQEQPPVESGRTRIGRKSRFHVIPSCPHGHHTVSCIQPTVNLKNLLI